MQKRLISIFIVVLLLINCSCVYNNTSSSSRDSLISQSTSSDSHNLQTSDSSSENDVNPENDIDPENPITMIFGKNEEIVFKNIEVTDPRYFAVFGVKDQRYLYSMDTIDFSGINIFDIQENKATLFRKPVKNTRVIKQAYLSDDWLLWEEDEDRMMYDTSYGKD